MIRFTCLCQNRIEVEEDLAGGLMQCPRCGRLNDVPTLSDLPHLADDGTYVVDVARPKDDPIRLAELSIVYSKGTTDSDGDVIDMRMASADLAAADASTPPADTPEDGFGEIPLKDEPSRRPKAVARPAPRYDPETGELIAPIELVEDPDRPTSPMAIPLAKAAINYASRETLGRTGPGRAAVDLLMPVNVTVMGFLFIAHVFLQFIGTVTVSGLWFIIAIPMALAGVIVGHYGNVIDETGPQERDELPRPLRQCGFFEDIWNPFVQVVCSLVICFAPAVLVVQRTRGALPPAVALALFGGLLALGIFFLPGVLLTTNTSGTIVNLRPDRFLGLVRTCGAGYGLAVLTGGLATITYGFGIVSSDMAFGRILGAASPLPVWVHVVGYPMLALGIYCAHLFCWHLGLLYREHHAQFPWVFQRHVRDPLKHVASPAARKGTLRDVASAAGQTGAAPAPTRPRKDTREKLRELRELERRRRAQQQQTDPPARWLSESEI